MSLDFDPLNGAREWGKRAPWDVCVLGGLEIPGVSDVKADRGRSVEQRELIGQNASTTFLAYRPAKVSITVKLWTEDQFAALADLLKKIEPATSEKVLVSITTGAISQQTKPQPVDIVHPSTRLRGIRRIYVERIEGPTRDQHGIYTLRIEAAEWWPVVRKNIGHTFTPLNAQRFDMGQTFGGQTAVQPRTGVQLAPSHGVTPAIATRAAH